MTTKKDSKDSGTGDRFKPVPGTCILIGRTYKIPNYSVPPEELTRRRIQSELKNRV